ncbi:MAG: hypothetical protein ABL984_03070 [Pyrinomonadaceae bacterium]
MKRIGMLMSIAVVSVVVSTASAQQEAPAGASDRGPMDRSMKTRSAELERVKRDAEKPDPKNPTATMPPNKFAEVKEDFEGLQLRQDEIRKIYSEGKQVDTAKIATVAVVMNANATRLQGNLFPIVEEPKTKKKPKDQKDQPAKVEPTPEPLPHDLRSMIVAQDDTLAAFVANPMFTNPQVSNVDDNARAHADLKKLIRLTAALKVEAEKRPN